jgi:S1-C subfamily serine protease
MAYDPTDPTEPQRSEPGVTEPIEYQRYGPQRSSAARQASWQAAPSWSTRPPDAERRTVPERRGPGLFSVAVVALVIGLISGALGGAVVSGVLREPVSPIPPADEPTGETVAQNRITESSAVIDAVNQVAPSVVTITSQRDGIFSADGVGSGFLYDADGWIVTNKHVVRGVDEVAVRLSDSRVLTGRVMGEDTLTDLAIVKVDASDLPVAPLGSSTDLAPGQLAIAIGNPLGSYESSVTSGVVSGLGRNIRAADAARTSSEALNNLIQTDAAINPGNSGGPLVNSAGQVIGINTAVSQDAQGIGFAIPIDVARPIMEQARNGEPIARPWIGVFYTLVNKQLAADHDLPVEYGAYVSSGRPDAPAVFPDSPAARAGIREGDVIVAVNGERVGESRDLSMLVLPHAPGDEITLRILRRDSAREVTVTLGTLPADR